VAFAAYIVDNAIQASWRTRLVNEVSSYILISMLLNGFTWLTKRNTLAVLII